MYISREEVKTITGYDVDAGLLGRAQSIIESFTGRLEAEIDDARDLALLGKATAYQAAYMKEDSAKIFEQMSVSQIGQFGQLVSFRYDDNVSPFVAPLSVMACRNLSWRRSRSIRTGSWFGVVPMAVERWQNS